MTAKAPDANDTGDPHGATRLVPGMDLRAGQLVAGRYRAVSLIGTRGTELLVSATHAFTRQPVVLKLIACYTDMEAACLDELLARAREATALRGEHLAAALEVGTTETGLPYVACEQLEGSTLEAELALRGALPFREATHWILEACAGLAEAHGLGIVHGALNPSRLLLTERADVREPKRGGARAPGSTQDRKQQMLKVLDLGTALSTEAKVERSLSTFDEGLAYLSPELVRGMSEVTPASDVWALGFVLYELVAGSPPFSKGSTSETMLAIVTDTPPLLTEAPYELARFVHRCLSKDPDERPRNAAEVAKGLVPFLDDEDARLAARVEATFAAASKVAGDRPVVRERRREGRASPATSGLEQLPDLGLRPGWKTWNARRRSDDASRRRQAGKRRRSRTWLVGAVTLAGAVVVGGLRLRQAGGADERAEVEGQVLVPAPRSAASLDVSLRDKARMEARTDDDGLDHGPRAGQPPRAAQEQGKRRVANTARRTHRLTIVRTPPWPDPPQLVAPPVAATPPSARGLVPSGARAQVPAASRANAHGTERSATTKGHRPDVFGDRR